MGSPGCAQYNAHCPQPCEQQTHNFSKWWWLGHPGHVGMCREVPGALTPDAGMHPIRRPQPAPAAAWVGCMQHPAPNSPPSPAAALALQAVGSGQWEMPGANVTSTWHGCPHKRPLNSGSNPMQAVVGRPAARTRWAARRPDPPDSRASGREADTSRYTIVTPGSSH